MKLDLGMTPERFLSEYWQKRPLLVRQALPDFRSPIEANELAGLACEELVESRIVTGPDRGGAWTLEHGPFDEERFAMIGDRNWTLLVQDADKLLPEVEACLDCFRFIPDWRLDDIMISFAATGGSVGPHLDQYDVFLIQAEGHRRWSIDSRPSADTRLRTDSPLKLLETFVPDQDWELEPGDLLYLPPGIPHHGVALDPCMTWSVGLRSPSHEEILIDFAETVAARREAAQRYRDPGLQPASHPGEIGPDVIERLRSIIKEMSEDQGQLREWAGSFLTRYRLSHEPAAPEDLDDASIERSLRSTDQLARNPYSRLAYLDQDDGSARLFVCGEAWTVPLATAQLLTEKRSLDREDLATLCSDPASRAALGELLRGGHFNTGMNDDA